MLYIGSADGGSGGDPLNQSQNLESIFGKILRIDPLGKNSTNGKYGIPAVESVRQDNADTLGEIYAVRPSQSQRFAWDPKNGNMFEAEIGQNIDEEINQIIAGGNYGWNVWEGSFGFFDRESAASTISAAIPKMVYPDRRVRADGSAVAAARPRPPASTSIARRPIPQLTGLLIFGDNPSGEMFYVNADNLPKGGQSFQPHPVQR